MPVLLWTDALFFVLLACVAVYVAYLRANPHLRLPWRQVAHSRPAVASAVVLLVFTFIAVLDSLHFRPRLDDPGGAGQALHSVEVLSVLDVLLAPLRERVERTYSAPLATHAYVKESIERADGTQVRDYPRLRFGGAHLLDPAHCDADVAATVLISLLEAAALWLIVALALALWLGRGRSWSPGDCLRALAAGAHPLPWRTLLVSVGAVLSVALLCVNLSAGYHVLGTDKVGQDVLYLALKSVRTGLLIGTLTTLVMLPFAVLLGVVAGYFGGWADDVIQYLYTTLNSIPAVLLIAAAILMMQVYVAGNEESFASVTERADLRLLYLCMILGITSWTGLCRLLRAEVLKLREVEYIQAATAFGVGRWSIIARHILPNVMHIVLILVVLDFSVLVLAEAVLAYVNIGVDPTMASWGGMINSARLELAREPVVWWSLVAALVFMFTLVLAANLFADAVRDAFDPRTRKL